MLGDQRIQALVALLWVLWACAPDTGEPTGEAEPEAPPPLRVTVVGIDGASWRVIDPLLARGELPHLAGLVARGTRAQLRSEAPLVSPPVWTTIATGVPRERHGIRGFVARKSRTLVSSVHRRVPALWNLASRGGLRSAVLGWWATYPAESIEGVVVSDRTLKTRRKSVRRITSVDSLRDTRTARLVHPPEALATIDELIAAPVPGGENLEDFDVVATMRLEDTTIARSLLRLREHHGPFHLELLLLRGVDPVSHHFWHYHEPEASVYAPGDRPDAEALARVGDPVEEHYRFVDALLGELLAGPERVVLVVSDHGFEAGYQRFRGGAGRLLGKHTSPAAQQGILVAAGGPFRAGTTLEAASIFDLAPTVLRLLELPIADDLPGRVLSEALEADWLASHPERRVPTYAGPAFDVADPEADTTSPGDEALREELRALGYIE